MENPDEAPKKIVNISLSRKLVLTLTKKPHLPIMGIDNIGILIRMVQLFMTGSSTVLGVAGGDVWEWSMCVES